MSHIILRLDRNVQIGLPRLTVEGLTLSRADQATLERELHERFEELVAMREDDIFEIRTPLRRLPRPAEFRVTHMSYAQSQRCPDVVLASVHAIFSEPAEDGILRWDEFRAAAGKLLSQVRPGQQGPLRNVLSEFCQLEKEPTQKQLLSVVSGYLLLQRVLCDANDQNRCFLLEAAMAALVKAFGSTVVRTGIALAAQDTCPCPPTRQPPQSRNARHANRDTPVL